MIILIVLLVILIAFVLGLYRQYNTAEHVEPKKKKKVRWKDLEEGTPLPKHIPTGIGRKVEPL